MGRKRKPIRKDDYLAAALACLLSQEQRDALRSAKVPAQEVIRLFSPDHIGLHCFEAPDRDEWHNLHPRLRPEHKEKSKRDTSIAAKVKRIRENGLPAPVAELVEVMDSQIPRHGARKAAGKSFGRPRPKRAIPRRAHPWPPRGSRPFRPRTSP